MSILYVISRSAFEIAIRILFKMRIIGKEKLPTPPFIIASNHTSLVDPPLVGVACKPIPVDFIVKQELVDGPVIGEWTKRVRCIPVRRGENSIKGLREAISRLKKGHVVGIFPEGTRSVDGSLQEAKVGTGFLIAKAKVPVVPFYAYGTSRAFPKGGGVKVGTRVGGIVGDPIYPEKFDAIPGKGKEKYEAISTLIMEHISSLKEKSEKM
jgi:1-acyl-sn-glycerol-3-phosphate acyltransferase